MTEEQNSLEPGANGANGATPQEIEIVATPNATTDNSHQVGDEECAGETVEDKQHAHKESLDTAVAKQSSEIQRTSAAWFCPKCGLSLSPDDSFCPGCGSPIQRISIPISPTEGCCPKCGTELEDDQAFCMRCGTKIR